MRSLSGLAAYTHCVRVGLRARVALDGNCGSPCIQVGRSIPSRFTAKAAAGKLERVQTRSRAASRSISPGAPWAYRVTVTALYLGLAGAELVRS